MNGDGSGGRLLGAINQTGTNAASYTDASPTAGECLDAIRDAITTHWAARHASPDAIVMSPKRYEWLCKGTETAHRIFGQGGSAANPLPTAAQGYVAGLPCYLDETLPQTMNGSQEPILLLTAKDHWIAESPVVQIVATNYSGSSTLTAQIVVYRSAFAWFSTRPESLTVMSGTGLVAL